MGWADSVEICIAEEEPPPLAQEEAPAQQHKPRRGCHAPPEQRLLLPDLAFARGRALGRAERGERGRRAERARGAEEADGRASAVAWTFALLRCRMGGTEVITRSVAPRALLEHAADRELSPESDKFAAPL